MARTVQITVNPVAWTASGTVTKYQAVAAVVSKTKDTTKVIKRILGDPKSTEAAAFESMINETAEWLSVATLVSTHIGRIREKQQKDNNNTNTQQQ